MHILTNLLALGAQIKSAGNEEEWKPHLISFCVLTCER